MHGSKYISGITFLIIILMPGGSPLQAANSKWDNLHKLQQGQLIRVELNNAKSYEGNFQTMTGGGITLQSAAGEQMYARRDIRSVSVHVGHRGRNIALGVAAGLGAGLLLTYLTRDPKLSSWRQYHWFIPAITVPAGAVGVGAIPPSGWHEVYRTH